MRVSVIGASGAIGRSTVAALLDAGHGVRAIGRSTEKLEAALGPRRAVVEVISADVTTVAGCERAVSGADAVVYAPGLPYRSKSFAQYPAITRTMLDACTRAASVRAFVHISNVYPYGVPQQAVVTEAHPLAPVGPKGRYRKKQEDVVLSANVRGGLETAVLRLPTFFGAHADNSIVARAAAAIARHARPPLLAPVDAATEYVVVDDVGPVIAALLGQHGWGGEAYNMAGTGLATQRELAQLLMNAAGANVALRILPVWVRRALGMVAPIFRELREVDYLLATSFVLSEAKLVAQLGAPVAHTPFPLAAERWIASLAASAASVDGALASTARR